jgi:hypothetical protein
MKSVFPLVARSPLIDLYFKVSFPFPCVGNTGSVIGRPCGVGIGEGNQNSVLAKAALPEETRHPEEILQRIFHSNIPTKIGSRFITDKKLCTSAKNLI